MASPTRSPTGSLPLRPQGGLRHNIVEQLRDLKSCMPLREDQVDFAGGLIRRATLEELELAGLAAPPMPAVPPNLQNLPLRQRLRAVQDVISSLKYNHTKEQYFNVSKDRPLGRILDTARQMLREGLPIKCVEAVFLALYLTSDMEDIDRIPVGFKSCMNGHVHRHIVLLIRERATGQFGALGLSRRKELAFKELKYNTCSDILADYRRSYEKWWHEVLKIRIGLPVEQGEDSRGHAVCWRYLSLKVPGEDWATVATAIDKYSECCRRLLSKWKVSGVKEDLAAVTKVDLDDGDANSDHGDFRRSASTSRGTLVASRPSAIFDYSTPRTALERSRSSADRVRSSAYRPSQSFGAAGGDSSAARYPGVATPREREAGASGVRGAGLGAGFSLRGTAGEPTTMATSAPPPARALSRGRGLVSSRASGDQHQRQQHGGSGGNGAATQRISLTPRQSSQFTSAERQRPPQRAPSSGGGANGQANPAPVLLPSSGSSARLNSRGGGSAGQAPPAWGAGPGVSGAAGAKTGAPFPSLFSSTVSAGNGSASPSRAAAAAAATGAKWCAVQPGSVAARLPVLTQAC